MQTNIYLEQIYRVLPRILALFDRDQTSHTYGVGDRLHWGWKLIDYANATPQGAANGLARLLVNNLFPSYIDVQAVLQQIELIFHGAKKLTRNNGSLEEAFPYEHSFCVTALVAYDLLTAIELLNEKISDSKRLEYLAIIKPLINFLRHANENHAFISNHLATAAAAFFKWTIQSGDNTDVYGHELLNLILEQQSDEGWFREYEGADPGYQSLCTYYLADIHRLRPDLNLASPLQKSLEFFSYFVHPDGSLGGYYGSRNTRFFYPAGFELLASQSVEAASIVGTMRPSIAHHNVVTLDTMDFGNLIPMFNAYCWAASLIPQTANSKSSTALLPACSDKVWQKHFPKAGLFIDKGQSHYTIVSLHKGGVAYHFDLAGDQQTINVGKVARDKRGKTYSTQAYQEKQKYVIEKNKIILHTPMVAMHRALPTPFQFILLRLLNVTVMRSNKISGIIKKLLVKMLITNNKTVKTMNQRTIYLGKNLRIKDDWLQNQSGLSYLHLQSPFSAIHMASQGYWQQQDTQ